MAVRLHRCKHLWIKAGGHPCWRVQKALDDAGVDHEVVPLPWPGRGKRENIREHTGQEKYPAIEFDDGTWYRAESKEMAETIRAGRLDQMHGATPVVTPGR